MTLILFSFFPSRFINMIIVTSLIYNLALFYSDLCKLLTAAYSFLQLLTASYSFLQLFISTAYSFLQLPTSSYSCLHLLTAYSSYIQLNRTGPHVLFFCLFCQLKEVGQPRLCLLSNSPSILCRPTVQTWKCQKLLSVP